MERFAYRGEHVPYVGTLKGSTVAYSFSSLEAARGWAANSGGRVWPVAYEDNEHDAAAENAVLDAYGPASTTTRARPPSAAALIEAVREIESEAVAKDSILQAGAAFALGTLADAVKAGPGCTAEDMARALLDAYGPEQP